MCRLPRTSRIMRITSKEILNDPLSPVLIRMTIPMILGIFFMFLFTAVDTWFISLMGTKELAAISFAAPVTFFIMSMVIGLSVGVVVMIGRVIGKGDQERSARMTSDCLLFSLLLTIVVAVGGYLSIDPLFTLLGASAESLVLIHQYMDIWFFFVALLVIPMVGNSALRATGDTKWPGIIMIVGGLINVILDPILIFGWGSIPAMGIAGAAWATVGSWLVSFVIGMLILAVREKLILLSLPKRDVLLSHWGELIKIGVPISVANIMLPLTLGILTAMLAQFGEAVVAGFGAGGRIESFALIVAMAITASLSPFMAQNLGANQQQRAHDACMLMMKYALTIQFVLWILLFVFARPLANVFSNEEDVVSITTLYLKIMPAGALFYTILIILNTAFNAHENSNTTLLSSTARLVLFVVPCAWFGSKLHGVDGLFVGCVIGNILSSIFGWWLYRKHHHPEFQQLEA